MGHRRLVALAGALLALAGCGSGAEKTQPDAGFPLTVKAANGEVRIEKRPARIVSISATATEDLFAVGAGRQVKAVDDYSTYPPSAPRTKLSGYTPNAEAIAGYRPDLVVVSDDTNHVVSALERLGIPVLVNPPAADLAGAYAQIEQLGRATGHLPQARKVVQRMRLRVAAMSQARHAGGKALSVYHELDPTYFSASSRSFVGSVYRLLGLRNIADNARKAGAYPKLSSEYVVAANPDLIVLADTICCSQKTSKLRGRPGFADVAAVRKGDVLAVPDDLASHWGPRIANFMELVAKRVASMREAER